MAGSNEVRVVNKKTGGMKGSKAEKFSLLPWDVLGEVSRLYAFGAKKYDADNWRKGYDWSLSYDALMRHAAAWWTGQFDDDESKCDHMSSVVFHALALMYFRHAHPDLDDRTPLALNRLEAPSVPESCPEPPSRPQGGAVAVFRHVGPAPMIGGPLYYVSTGMEAPSGYRFSHVEDGISIGRQIVPSPVKQQGTQTVSPVASRRIDRAADGTPVPQAISDAPLQ